jgi:hypothetical protein
MRVTDMTLAMLGIPPEKITGDMDRAAAELKGLTIDSSPPGWLNPRRS